MKYETGDILLSPADCLVVPVDLSGVMEDGLEGRFADRFPKMYRAYKHACTSGSITLGKCLFFEHPLKVICAFPVRAAKTDPVTYEDISVALQYFVNTAAALGITSAAFPKLEFEGVVWDDLVDLFDLFEEHNIDVTIYEPEDSIPTDELVSD